MRFTYSREGGGVLYTFTLFVLQALGPPVGVFCSWVTPAVRHRLWVRRLSSGVKTHDSVKVAGDAPSIRPHGRPIFI